MSSKEPPLAPVCKYFLQNKCTYGSACLYSHSSACYPRYPKIICEYYQRGCCRFGSQCARLHPVAEKDILQDKSTNRNDFYENGPPKQPSSTKSKTSPFGPCKFFAQGNCTNGDTCPFPHVASITATHVNPFSVPFKGLKKEHPTTFTPKKDDASVRVCFMAAKRPCTFFAQGECRDGAKCQFLHPSPEFPSPENHMVSSKKDVSLLVCYCILLPLISTCTDKFTSVDDQFVHNRNQKRQRS